MGGTVVYDPENATRRLVGFSAHDFSNQAIDRSNAGFLFAAAEHLGPMRVSRRQSRSMRLHGNIRVRLWWNDLVREIASVAYGDGLGYCFFVCRDDELTRT
jgi:hypothetical protein